MDPAVYESAMAMMNKMTPEQLANLQKQVDGLPPSVIEEQTRLFANLSAEQKRQIADRAKDLDPALISRATEELPASGLLREVGDLKTEGNILHGQKDYTAAIQKYSAAVGRLNQTGSLGSAGCALLLACKLNLSSCHLKLGHLERCISLCTEVLNSDGSNLKARYRRGQALLGQGKFDAAAADLQVAYDAAPTDQRDMIQAALKDAESRRSSSRTSLSAATDQLGDLDLSAVSPSSQKRLSSIIPEAQQSSAARPVQDQASSGGPRAEVPPNLASLMKDPALVQAAAKMIDAMTPEQMAGLANSQCGELETSTDMRGLLDNPELMGTMHAMMRNIGAKDLQLMSARAGHDMSEAEAAAISERFHQMSTSQIDWLIWFMKGMQYVKSVLHNRVIILLISLLVLAIGVIWAKLQGKT